MHATEIETSRREGGGSMSSARYAWSLGSNGHLSRVDSEYLGELKSILKRIGWHIWTDGRTHPLIEM